MWDKFLNTNSIDKEDFNALEIFDNTLKSIEDDKGRVDKVIREELIKIKECVKNAVKEKKFELTYLLNDTGIGDRLKEELSVRGFKVDTQLFSSKKLIISWDFREPVKDTCAIEQSTV